MISGQSFRNKYVQAPPPPLSAVARSERPMVSSSNNNSNRAKLKSSQTKAPSSIAEKAAIDHITDPQQPAITSLSPSYAIVKSLIASLVFFVACRVSCSAFRSSSNEPGV